MGRLSIAVLGLALSAAPPAAADVGHGPPPPPPPCSFALSVPAQQSEMLTATVQSTGCAPLAVPYYSVACLQPAGGATVCVQAHGSDPAVVSLPSGARGFVATGRGCAGWIGLPPAPDCQLLGPATRAP